jgi:hypothetical protein
VAELECIHRYIDNNIYPLEHTYDLVYNFWWDINSIVFIINYIICRP